MFTQINQSFISFNCKILRWLINQTENRRVLFSIGFSAKCDLVFVLTMENAFMVLGISEIALFSRDRHVFTWQSLEILNFFNTLTLKQLFWKTKTFFKNLERFTPGFSFRITVGNKSAIFLEFGVYCFFQIMQYSYNHSYWRLIMTKHLNKYWLILCEIISKLIYFYLAIWFAW